MQKIMEIHSILPSRRDRWAQFRDHLRGGSVHRILTAYVPRIRDIIGRSGQWTTREELAAGAAGLLKRMGNGESPDSRLVEVFALTAAASRIYLGLDPRPVQLAAALAIQDNRVAELPTGEGKTLAAVFPAIMAGLTGKGVHLMTANDYLAERDARWMEPLYRVFNLRVDWITAGTPPEDRRSAYGADITYLTIREAGFDFLRDSIAPDGEEIRHRPLHHAIVDEADYLLIDEARIPMVIAGRERNETHDLMPLNRVVGSMREGEHFVVDSQVRNAWFTTAGYDLLERETRCGGLFHRKNKTLLSIANTVLHARSLLEKDLDYINGPDGIEVVDEFTGRTNPLRRWPDGIHQAVEVKEGFPPRPEGRILGSITVQNFMKLYPRLAGMTATAAAASEEFKTVYGLEVLVVPPHRPCIRVDEPDRIFAGREEKYVAMVEEIRRQNKTGRPVLVGTATVGESEELARRLKNGGVACRVLNARNPALEAGIIAGAGCPGGVTISTNMAGRGVDIRLGGGDPEREKTARRLGGLLVLGTSRHESRRMDDQLRGRAGRQGDPGGSCFFLSLEDDLVKRFQVSIGHLVDKNSHASTWRSLAHREVAHAQRMIAGKMAQARRILCDYSTILENQRRRVWEFRGKVLRGDEVLRFLEEAASRHGISPEIASEKRETLKRRLLMHIDSLWADHLEYLRDLRSGIHLARLAGGTPLAAYEQAAARAFARFRRRLGGAVLREARFLNSAPDMSPNTDRGGSTATWTYLVNDDPFRDWKLDLIAGSRIGFAAVAPLVLILNFPLVLALRMLKRMRRKG